MNFLDVGTAFPLCCANVWKILSKGGAHVVSFLIEQIFLKNNKKPKEVLMKIQPLKDKILVRPIKAEKQTDSGILIPETVETEKPQEGEVLAVGTGRITPEGKTIPPEIRVGDRILFTKYSPNEIKHEGEELYILSEGDILAIIK